MDTNSVLISTLVLFGMMMISMRVASPRLRQKRQDASGLDNNTLKVMRPERDNDEHQQQHQQSFHVFVAVDKFKFNASHFIAYSGFRERLHGHNYRVSLRVFGGPYVNGDGYVMDFGNIKTVVANVCKTLNEHFILPAQSDVLKISYEDGNVNIECDDGCWFSFPRDDVISLPIIHSSAEELAAYLWGRIIHEFGLDELRRRGVTEVEVIVAEAENQEASFRKSLAGQVNVVLSPPRPCVLGE